MARILCLDTEPETVEALRSHGHQAEVGDIGFRTAKPHLEIPPHEVELIVCDLRRPACFDRLSWGPGLNDNHRAVIVPSPTDAMYEAGGQAYPRYQIIYHSQLPGRAPGHFGPDDVLRAIAVGGVPALLFLNPDWVRHVGKIAPNFFGVTWPFRRTLATVVTLTQIANELVQELDTKVRIQRPIRFAISADPLKPTDQGYATIVPLITNAVGDVFGQMVLIGRGPIIAVPALEDNPLFVHLLAGRLGDFKDLDKPRRDYAALLLPGGERTPGLRGSPRAADPHGRRGVEPVAAVGPAEPGTTRDVFVSYASEDRDRVARPLADALIGRGLTVWFDEFELQIGDSLRRKIENGLASSRFGVTILSRDFFEKPWPKRELDTLIALEAEELRILPVWHGVTARDIRELAPLLADRFAVSTERGVDAVADAIFRKVRGVESGGSRATGRIQPVGDFHMSMRVFSEQVAPGLEAAGNEVKLPRLDRLYVFLRDGWQEVVEEVRGQSHRLVIGDGTRIDNVPVIRRRSAS